LVEAQVVKLAEIIQQLQGMIVELEAQVVLRPSQEVHDHMEEIAKNTIVRIKSLTSE
jgi:N-methylhydantoinase B/oxoprolinase/acetone carboxylase alpha subunit